MSRILVVDDSRLSRRFVTKPLREAGHEIIEATNGQEALEAFHEHAPDCVVSDLLMPVMDGPTFIAHLREESTVPIVVISADIQDSTREIVDQLGVTRFLNKPFKADELMAAIDQALGQIEGVQ